MTSYDKIDLHLSKDKVLAPAVNALDFPLRFFKGDLYFALLKSIVSQQLSLKAAATIHGRFLNMFEDLYPEPHALIDKTEEELRAVGLSRRKAEYMQNVALFHLEHNLQDARWMQMSDEEIIEQLTQIKGIGEWTVHMILMFNLCRPDVFPVGDLAIVQGMVKMYGLKETKKKELHARCEKIAKKWSPYRSYGSFYIWNWKDKSPND